MTLRVYNEGQKSIQLHYTPVMITDVAFILADMIIQLLRGGTCS